MHSVAAPATAHVTTKVASIIAAPELLHSPNPHLTQALQCYLFIGYVYAGSYVLCATQMVPQPAHLLLLHPKLTWCANINPLSCRPYCPNATLVGLNSNHARPPPLGRVFYIPPRSQQPLSLGSGAAYSIPGWGGVVALNPDANVEALCGDGQAPCQLGGKAFEQLGSVVLTHVRQELGKRTAAAAVAAAPISTRHTLSPHHNPTGQPTAVGCTVAEAIAEAAVLGVGISSLPHVDPMHAVWGCPLHS